MRGFDLCHLGVCVAPLTCVDYGDGLGCVVVCWIALLARLEFVAVYVCVAAAVLHALFDVVAPVLQDQGENVFYLGAVGSGHTIKLINNFFGMTIANAMAEAFAMADVAGVDRAQLYDVMAAGPLNSGMMGFVKAYGVDGDPSQLAFAIKNAAKDVGYYARMAEEAGIDSLMSEMKVTGTLILLNRMLTITI